MNIPSKNEFADGIDTLIARFLNSDLSASELEAFKAWISESDQNREYYQQIRNIWESTGQTTVSVDRALENVFGKINRKPVKWSLLHIWQKAAAVLIIPLMLSTAWFMVKNQKNQDSRITYHSITSAFGLISSTELPDGSKVWLNSGSSIKYPDRFTGNSREVDLSGEAYFEVKSNIKCPFCVNVSGIRVKATGTRFDVLAYENAGHVSIALAEGVVEIELIDENSQRKMVELRPAQSMKYDIKSKKITILNEDAYKHYAWKDGKMVFRDDSFSEVAYRISLQYNADVEILDDQIRNYRYYATFQNESIKEVFDLLKLSSPFDYRMESQKILPDGTFTRTKIIIFKHQ